MAIIEFDGLASWHLIGQLCLFPTNVVKDEIDMIAPIVSSHKYIFGILEPSPQIFPLPFDWEHKCHGYYITYTIMICMRRRAQVTQPVCGSRRVGNFRSAHNQ